MLTSDWIKFSRESRHIRELHQLVAKQVCLECVQILLQKVELVSTFYNNFPQTATNLVKRATSLLNSCCSNVANQVTRFFARFTVPLEADLSKNSHHYEAKSRKL